MNTNQINCDEIRDRHLSTMIKLAFEYEDALEARQNDEEAENMPEIDTARKDAVWNTALEKMIKTEYCEKKKHSLASLRRPMTRIIEIAACLVLAIGIALPIAIANVEAIRVKVMELMIDIQNDHTGLRFVENDTAEFYVPAQWHGSYYPQYVPDGFELEEISKLSNEATYTNGNGAYIYFGEYTEDDCIDVNSENAVLSYTMVNGSNAFVIEREECVIVSWNTEDRYFVLIADTSADNALAIARSVRKIIIEK